MKYPVQATAVRCDDCGAELLINKTRDFSTHAMMAGWQSSERGPDLCPTCKKRQK